MLSRRAVSSAIRRTVARSLSSEAAPPSASSGKMTLNFNLPHETIYSAVEVNSVIVPGAAGEYGVTADHVPVVAQLKPGVLQIIHEDGEPEKFFVAGGFSLTHPNSITVSYTTSSIAVILLAFLPSPGESSREPTNSNLNSNLDTNYGSLFIYFPLIHTQDIACPEAVKLDDIDSSAVSSNFDAAKTAFANAEAGSKEQAEAQIDIEVNKAMGAAVGLNLI